LNKREKEVIQAQLDSEKAVLKELEKQYQSALDQINEKIKLLQSDELTQSKVYQLQYQQALKGQVEGIIEKLHGDEYSTIQQYLSDSYTTGFVGTMYDVAGQGIPMILPIDQNAAVKAILTDSKINDGLYKSLGVDTNNLKKSIRQEITRGVASGLTYNDIARNVHARTKAPLSNARRIVQTEGHRIQQASTFDAQQASKAKGADVVKQWDSTLDGATRPTHRKLDGQIREVDEPFEEDGKEAMFPGDFGDPAEDCNCRCVSLTRARWALDEGELQTLKDRAAYFGLDKTKDFEDFKNKYLKAAEIEKTPKVETIDSINESGTQMLASVYEEHRTRNGLSSVPYDELGSSRNNIVQANYGNMSVESAKAFNDAITQLANEYDTPLQRIRTMTKNEYLGRSSSLAYVSHDYTVDSAELVINPAKCKDLDKLTERVIELSDRGYCARVRPELAGSYVATHEFAHTLLNTGDPLKNSTNWLGADYGKIRAARREINSVYENYLSEVERLTKAKREAEFLALTDATEDHWQAAASAIEALNAVKISDYSLGSADEFMAEAFANEKIGTNSKEHARQVLDILDRYFKG